jgi:hypothetical protein
VWIVTLLDELNSDLLEAMFGGCEHPVRMIHMTISLIEWEGGLEPGTVPAQARRLARAWHRIRMK